jgi:hypothetical protein
MTRTIRFTLLLTLLGALAACGNAAAPAAQTQPTSAPVGRQPTAPPLPTAAPTPARSTAATANPAATLPVAVATTTPQPTATSDALPEGLTPEGYHYLGRADAPATLVMYSDFL